MDDETLDIEATDNQLRQCRWDSPKHHHTVYIDYYKESKIHNLSRLIARVHQQEQEICLHTNYTTSKIMVTQRVLSLPHSMDSLDIHH
jgi:hypothetical protein